MYGQLKDPEHGLQPVKQLYRSIELHYGSRPNIECKKLSFGGPVLEPIEIIKKDWLMFVQWWGLQ